MPNFFLFLFLAQIELCSSLLPTVPSAHPSPEQSEELIWGLETDFIRKRVLELCDESSLFHQIHEHLASSVFPFSVIIKDLDEYGGQYLSKNGMVILNQQKMPTYLTDAAIIEEFVHAYQSLYYNYSHGLWRHKQLASKSERLQQKRDAIRLGMKNWLKFGDKSVYIEAEAKLLTFFIQHQTCSIPLEAISKTDKLNTGGKGSRLVKRYLQRKIKLKKGKYGHLKESNQLDAKLFSNYQKLLMEHWRKRASGPSPYTRGYFFHKPEALNNVYENINNNNYRSISRLDLLGDH